MTSFPKPPTPPRQGLTSPSKSQTPKSGSHIRLTSTTTTTRSHSQQNSFASLEELMKKDDLAERGLMHSIEERRTTVPTDGGDVWRASVNGERPPLGAVPLDQFSNVVCLADQNSLGGSWNSGDHKRRLSGSLAGGGSSHGSSQNSAGKLADIARKMRQKAIVATTLDGSDTAGSSQATSSSNHRRGQSRAGAILDSIQEQQEQPDAVFDNVMGLTGTPNSDETNDTNNPTLEIEQATNSTDRLLTGAMHVEELFETFQQQQDQQAQADTEPEPEKFVVAEGANDPVVEEQEQLLADPATVPTYSSLTQSACAANSEVSVSNSPRFRPHHQKQSPKLLRAKSAAKKRKARWQRFVGTWCNPLKLFQRLWNLLWHQSYVLHIVVPCFATAWFAYYVLDNPKPSFLPGNASLSWWLNFMGQQVLILECSRIFQWVLIDKLVLGTRLAVQCLGPLLTLVFIQARGYPFCMATWGFLDLILLEGSNSIEQCWFYFTGLYLQGDGSGKVIMSSDLYIRLLVSMILAGSATAIKRTAVAMYFGKRTFMAFKPRLERLLKDVVLVSELAALAEEAEIAASEEGKLLQDTPGGKEKSVSQVKFLGDVTWSRSPRSSRRALKKGGNAAQKGHGGSSNHPHPPNTSGDSDSDDDDDSELTTQNDIRPPTERPDLQHDASGNLRIKDLLDHWDEPVNRMDKSLNASISDILRFRRALTFMDDDHLFGETFGPASTRDELITSAHDVYHRLLKLTPGRNKLSCEFYDMLALDDDGETVNVGKRKALRKLFRPDRSNELSLLAFVQCCDSLYKKLRYFRANVGNASVIDHALEAIVDGAFSFVLILLLLSVMRINPWPLLVSISTLLVSISFAVGSSASKWFEGMLLVAARRPYDLGDRIYMNDPSIIITDGLWYCWFVEDINLFHTTVRYAGTNEVATINNGSVANMRIVNGARSPNAAVWFQFAYRANLMEDGNIDKVKAALEEYAKNNPRNWHSFSYFRVDEVHPELEKLVVTIGLQHRSAWQDLVRILEAKAAVMCWLMEYSRKLGIIYDELPRRELLYYAGSLKDGAVKQHRYQLHDPSNITPGSFPIPSSTQSEGNQEIAQMMQHVPRAPSDATFLQQLQHSHG